MHKSKKAAIAAVAGGGLLLGGLGSLAYWEDAESAPGGTVTAGTLDISAPVCGSWKAGATDVVLATFRMVPGDSLTRTCTFTADVAGQNLKTKLAFVKPALDSSTLAGELTYGATYARNGGTAADLAAYDNATPTLTNIADNDTITVNYTVSLPFGGNEAGAPGVDNESNSGAEFSSGATGLVGGELTAVLSDLTLTVTQVS
ncbi:alternate-type signal peptide domain-containing protein [Nocardioides sp. AX2bis]|uniref:alternate-type signal peptide domain-containing protein n=1 Tax=Nocardioides sp. AX2bis TaxID=2653157 RepID=UPI0012F05909|nr:alternate-type signal peptide domain-containing protein [Nocardioides sp. AX2bis]VXB96302.1 conserved hypothetical protein [Nocardioides sp. AX2bis]